MVPNPSPQLIFEYIPLGTLKDINTQQRITDEEILTLLCQCLDALTSVHAHDIVHRDIKLENILVQSRDPFHIKLSDFGLSKATIDLKTFCGTHMYAAPELYDRQDRYYTKSCDIWSLGVVVFHYAYDSLRDFHVQAAGLMWCRQIIEKLKDCYSNDLLELLSTGMLVLNPERRLPAKECWERALRLSPEQRSVTPTQASHFAGYRLEGAPITKLDSNAREYEAELDQKVCIAETYVWDRTSAEFFFLGPPLPVQRSGCRF